MARATTRGGRDSILSVFTVESNSNYNQNLGLTNNAKFMFYASRPSVETSKTFNNYCKRKEADSPILGCYASQRIHIYDITDSRLMGFRRL